MNSNSLKNLRPWPKGQSGNVSGRPCSTLSSELRAVASLTHLEACKRISKIARMTETQMSAHMLNSETSVLDKNICAIFLESIEKGDYARLSFLLDRSAGKAPLAIEDDETDSVRDELRKLSMTELLTLVKNNLPEDV